MSTAAVATAPPTSTQGPSQVPIRTAAERVCKALFDVRAENASLKTELADVQAKNAMLNTGLAAIRAKFNEFRKENTIGETMKVPKAHSQQLC